MTERRPRPAPYPQIIRCPDPDNCEFDLDHIETSDGLHHYGCECSECVEFYRSLK